MNAVRSAGRYFQRSKKAKDVPKESLMKKFGMLFTEVQGHKYIPIDLFQNDQKKSTPSSSINRFSDNTSSFYDCCLA